MSNCFVDSNVILYVLDLNERKSSKAREILSFTPILNSQVLVEVINVARRKFGYTKENCLNFWIDLHKFCEIVPISKTTTQLTSELVQKYNFQIFDALIVASALEAGCKTLYSEDLQNGQMIENQLAILNPFIE
jgi:predicted nucleic acid-binding protein